jgi:peroxiredoxin
MNTTFRLITLILAASTPLAAFAAPKAGAEAPNFSLTDTRGKTHSLSDFKGKHVVLEWVNHGCPFVKKHYDSDNMQKLQKEFTGKGVIWLSVCSSAPGKQGHMSADEWNEAEKEKGAAPTAVLLDADGKVGQMYGAKTTPHMFVINSEGKIVYDGAIDSIKSANAADVPKAANYVRAALEESMAGKPVVTVSTKPYGCSVKY